MVENTFYGQTSSKAKTFLIRIIVISLILFMLLSAIGYKLISFGADIADWFNNASGNNFSIDWIDNVELPENLNVDKETFKKILEAELDSYESETKDLLIKSKSKKEKEYTYNGATLTYSCRLPWQFVYSLASMIDTNSGENGIKIKSSTVDKITDIFSSDYDEVYSYYKNNKTTYSYKSLVSLPHTIEGDFYIPAQSLNSAANYLYDYTYSYIKSNNTYKLKSGKRKPNKQRFIANLETLGCSEGDVDMLLKIISNCPDSDIIIDEIKYVLYNEGTDKDNWINAYGIDINTSLYDTYASTTARGVCIDGLVYDNPNAPLYSGPFAAKAKKWKSTVRKVAKECDMECYLDIIMAIISQESSFEPDSTPTKNNLMEVQAFKGGTAEDGIRAGINHLKKLITDYVTPAKITDMKALVQSYNFGCNYITGYVAKNGGRDTLELRQKMIYTQTRGAYTTSHYGDYNYADTVMSRVKGQIPTSSTVGNKINNLNYAESGLSVPIYYQSIGKNGEGSQWCTLPFGGGTVATSGCGPTSMAMIVSFWNQKEINPKMLLNTAFITNGKYNSQKWHAPAGLSHNAISPVVEQFNCVVKDAPINYPSETQVKKYLDQGYPILGTWGPGKFTRAGHFMVIRGYEKIGNKTYFYVNDPNAVDSHYVNGKQYSYLKHTSAEVLSSLKKIWVIVPNASLKQQLSSSSANQGTETVNTMGNKIATYAQKFVGNPYVWGGTSLTKGADCSGFVQSVYKNFGVSLPRTSREQAEYKGTIVSYSNAKPGDLLFYLGDDRVVGHVAMYIGDGKIVHASSPKTGIKISNATYRTIYRVIRVIK